MDAKKLEALNLLHYSPIDENEGMLGPPFPVVHNHLLCLDQGEVVVLAPHSQVSDLLPIGWEVFSPRVLSLVMSFEGTMVLMAEL